MTISQRTFSIGAFLLTPLISLTFFDRVVIPRLHIKWLNEVVAPSSKEFYELLQGFNAESAEYKPKLAFLDKPRTKDAGPFLNHRLPWIWNVNDSIGVYDSRTPLKDQIFIDQISLEKLGEKNLNLSDFNAHDFAQIDTSWLRRLREFDYWDTDKNSPVAKQPKYSMDSPAVNFLPKIMVIHMLQAKEKGTSEITESLLDILHYGELALTTETTMGEMVFTMALQYASGLSRGRPDIRSHLGPWASVIDEARPLRRLYLALSHFTRPMFGADPLTMKSVYLKHSPATGLCAAVRESLAMKWSYWSAFNDATPQLFSTLKDLVLRDGRGCRHTWIKEKTPPWVKLPNEKDFFLSDDGFKNLSPQANPLIQLLKWPARAIHYMPNTRRYVSSMLMYMATPSLTQTLESTMDN